jgi:hypothetical protein
MNPPPVLKGVLVTIALATAGVVSVPAIFGDGDVDIRVFSGIVVSDSTDISPALRGVPTANAGVTVQPSGRKRHSNSGLALLRTSPQGYLSTVYPRRRLSFLIRVVACRYLPQVVEVHRAGIDTVVRIAMRRVSPSSSG